MRRGLISSAECQLVNLLTMNPLARTRRLALLLGALPMTACGSTTQTVEEQPAAEARFEESTLIRPVRLEIREFLPLDENRRLELLDFVERLSVPLEAGGPGATAAELAQVIGQALVCPGLRGPPPGKSPDLVWRVACPPFRDMNEPYRSSAVTVEESRNGKPGSELVRVAGQPLFTELDLDPDSLRVATEDRGAPALHFAIRADAARRFRDWSEAHKGEPIALIMDGELIRAPRLRGRADGTGVLSGGFSAEELASLAKGLRAAASAPR